MDTKEEAAEAAIDTFDVSSWAANRRLKEQREIEAAVSQEKEMELLRLKKSVADLEDERVQKIRDERELELNDVYTKRVYANTYRNSHKTRINRLRRERDATPVGVFNKAKRRAKGRGQEWRLSFDNWQAAWLACPRIYDDHHNKYRDAFGYRSGNIQEGTQMRRKDTGKPWQVTNIYICYRNQSIPAHGIVSPWDYVRNEPVLPQEIIDNIAESKKLN